MNNINAPCQFCKERRVDETYICHSVCPKYIEFSQLAELIRQQRHQEIESKGIIINSARRTNRKLKGNKVII